MYKRIDILKERLVRQNIREKAATLVEQELLKEKFIRSKVRKLLKEIEMGTSPARSTAINVLEDLLKKIIPLIEEDFLDLTTSRGQRESFEKHILKAVSRILQLEDLRKEGDKEAVLESLDIKIDFDGEEEKDMLKSLGLDEEGLIDLEAVEETEEEKQEREFTITGLDITGRNMAMRTFKKVESSIMDTFEILADDKDRNIFHRYLIKNLQLYFKKFEEDLGGGGFEEAPQ